MPRPDDSTLPVDDLRSVERRAAEMLSHAGAWNVFPTPVDEILAAANLRVAPKSAFDIRAMVEYVKQKSSAAVGFLKSALSKVFGLYDANENIIHIDDSVVVARQTFLKLHETGHHALPHHRKVFTFFEECEQTLAPDIADHFEREANNFARFVLFQGDGFKTLAADMSMSVRSPLTLAKKFGASIYASAREFARTHHGACAVFVLERAELIPGGGFRAPIRRIEASAAFQHRFSAPTDTVIDHHHPLANLVPLGRRMKGPLAVQYVDRNGVRHECLADAFDTGHNVLILVHPVQALTHTTFILPNLGLA
jgi:Zn-dependent peptidase ImmA (M78 family)